MFAVWTETTDSEDWIQVSVMWCGVGLSNILRQTVKILVSPHKYYWGGYNKMDLMCLFKVDNKGGHQNKKSNR